MRAIKTLLLTSPLNCSNPHKLEYLIQSTQQAIQLWMLRLSLYLENKLKL